MARARQGMYSNEQAPPPVVVSRVKKAKASAHDTREEPRRGRPPGYTIDHPTVARRKLVGLVELRTLQFASGIGKAVLDLDRAELVNKIASEKWDEPAIQQEIKKAIDDLFVQAGK